MFNTHLPLADTPALDAVSIKSQIFFCYFFYSLILLTKTNPRVVPSQAVAASLFINRALGASFRKGQGDGRSIAGRKKRGGGRLPAPGYPTSACATVTSPWGSLKMSLSRNSFPLPSFLPTPAPAQAGESVCIKLTGHLLSYWQEELPQPSLKPFSSTSSSSFFSSFPSSSSSLVACLEHLYMKYSIFRNSA